MALNLDGARRLLNVSSEELSDDDLRRALVRFASDMDADLPPAEVAVRLRRFVDALNTAGLD